MHETSDAYFVPRDWNSPRTKTRVYPAHWAERDEVVAAYPTFDYPPAETEHSPTGFFKSLDNAWTAANRKQAAVTKVELLKRLEALGYANVKLSFSKYAGCTCPCSPGFIADQLLTDRVTARPLSQISLKEVTTK